MARRARRLTTLVAALVVLFASGFIPAASVTAQATTQPSYVTAARLAEATNPTTPIGQFGSASAYHKPGPEAMYGWVLRDLSDYLQRITGRAHPLQAGAGAGINVGVVGEFPEFAPANLGADSEAFVIEARGDRFYIVGRTVFGMMAGIYTFLDNLGVRWMAPGSDWETVPSRPTLAFDSTLNATSGGASYKWRGYFSTYGVNWRMHEEGVRDREYLLWQIRNRLGGAGYVSNSHNAYVIDPALRSTRPELFAGYADGTRSQTEVNRAHPDAVILAADRAEAYLRENDGKGSYFNSYSVEPNDGLPCDEQGRIAAGDGPGQCSNIDFDFATKVATEIERRGLTSKLIGMLSYSDHAMVPVRPIHPQVGVQVTTDLAFFPAGQEQTVEQRLAGFRDLGVTGNRLGIYDYMNLIAWSWDRPGFAPTSRPVELGQSFQRWHANGARTFTAETSDSWVNGGVGQYLAARMLWDATADPAAVRDAYYADAFGPAAADMRALADEWATKPELSRPNLARWWAMIDAAEAKAGADAKLRSRLADVKRYYLYLNLYREFNVDLGGIPSKADRWNALLRYVAQNGGEDSMHAVGLFFTLAYNTGQPGLPEVTQAELDPMIQRLLVNNYDGEAWATFPRISEADIEARFDAARLPLDGQATGTIDPVVKVLPAGGTPPATIQFPWLHNGGNAGAATQVWLKVEEATNLTLDIEATNQNGGQPTHTVVVQDPQGREARRVDFQNGTTGQVALPNAAPGVWTVTFPNPGSNRLTVSGGKTWGAVRMYNNRLDGWGYYPFTSGEASRTRFVIPANQSALKVGLSSGSVRFALDDGTPIGTVTGSAETKANPVTLNVPAAAEPRVAWFEFDTYSPGLAIEGVTLVTPLATGVMYESLDGTPPPPTTTSTSTTTTSTSTTTTTVAPTTTTTEPPTTTTTAAPTTTTTATTVATTTTTTAPPSTTTTTTVPSDCPPPSGMTQFATSNPNRASTSTLTAAFPRNPTAGNLLVAFVSAGAVPSMPGWTENAAYANWFRSAVFTKVAGAGESATVTANLAGDAAGAMRVEEWPGVTGVESVTLGGATDASTSRATATATAPGSVFTSHVEIRTAEPAPPTYATGWTGTPEVNSGLIQLGGAHKVGTGEQTLQVTWPNADAINALVLLVVLKP